MIARLTWDPGSMSGQPARFSDRSDDVLRAATAGHRVVDQVARRMPDDEHRPARGIADEVRARVRARDAEQLAGPREEQRARFHPAGYIGELPREIFHQRRHGSHNFLTGPLARNHPLLLTDS